MPTPCIYVTDSAAVRAGTPLPQLLQQLPHSLHQRALRYQREEDAYDFLLGRLLLQKALTDFQKTETIEQIHVDKNGKPFLTSVYFNISHTSGRVVCALSETGPIGIDIELEKAVELAPFTPWFTPTEWKHIHASAFPLQLFYRYWTRKESIIKALGLTLAYLNRISLDIDQEEFKQHGKQWHLSDLTIGAGYHGAICSAVRLARPIQLTYVDF